MNDTNIKNAPLLGYILPFLDIFGFNPLKNDSFAKFKSWVIFVLIVIYMLELFFGIFKLDNLEDISFDIPSVFALELILNKMAIISLNREALKNLIIRVQTEYWKNNRYDKNVEHKIERGYKILKKLIYALPICIVAVALIIFLNPILIKTKTLPYALYHVPTTNVPIKQYLIVQGLQLLLILPAVLSIYIFSDLFFATLIVYNINQLLLIKRGYWSIFADGEQLNKLISHHGLVLDSIREIDNIYSLYMTNLLLSTTVVTVMSLINIAIKGFPPNLSSILLIFFFLTMFLIFCFLGNLVSSESQNVADAVYECGWWKKDKIELRKQLILVLMRSQKPAKLSACHHSLDFSAFTQIIRATFNVFMFARALINKSK